MILNHKDEIDEIIPRINWGALNEVEKTMFSTSMLALEIGHRQKEKISAITSSKYVMAGTTMLMLLLMLFFNFSLEYMLIGCLVVQMLFFMYYQFLDHVFNKLFERAKSSTIDTLKRLQRKYPASDHNELL